jgi:hypothetical protein
VERSVLWSNKYNKSSTHRKSRKVQVKKKLHDAADPTADHATEDYTIPAETIRNVRVKVVFGAKSQKEWFVDKTTLTNQTGHTILALPTLLTAEEPYLPVANMSKSARLVRKGDVLGHLSEPVDYFDAPETDEDKRKMKEYAASVAAFINTWLDAEGNARLAIRPYADTPTVTHTPQNKSAWLVLCHRRDIQATHPPSHPQCAPWMPRPPSP